MKYKLFSIAGTILCGLLAATAAPVNERDETDAGSSYLFETLPKLTETSPTTRYYNFTLCIKNLSPDGYERPVWSVNGQYPGPLIQANKGDRIIVNVTNEFGDPSTVHWHGIFQRQTNWYDGVPGQTQCPIPSRTYLVYNFTVEAQSGTYWYHSHFMAQYVDGLIGPLIVHDSGDPYKDSYDEEYVATVSDWYHMVSADLLTLRMAPGYPDGNPVPDATLLSGRGQYNCSTAPSGSKCNSSVEQAIYKVQQGKKYRFRIINTSAYAYFTFSIDNHPLKVIEVEGEPVKDTNASTVNVLPIHIAQRYSVIVDCNQPVGNYFIRASIINTCLSRIDPAISINGNSSINYNATGILRYEGANSSQPTTSPYSFNFTMCYDLDSNAIRPYESKPPPQTVNNSFVFEVRPFEDNNGVGVFTINNSSFVPFFNHPSSQRLMAGENYTHFSESENAYAYDTPNGGVEIITFNMNNANHPFHLHGHAFWLVGVGRGTTQANITRNLDNPPIRDTATVPPFGYLVIRYIADNPGVWAFHCHIEWHVEMGMVAQLIERPTEFSNRTLPNDVRSLCVRYDSHSSNYPHKKRLPQNGVQTRIHKIK